MTSHPFFRMVDEVGQDPRGGAVRPKVFPNNRGLALDPVERPWARWEVGTLGDSGVQVCRVRSTGHGVDLYGATKWSYHLPLRGGMRLSFGRKEALVNEGEGALLGPASRRTHVLARSGDLFDSLVVLVDPARARLAESKPMAEPAGLVAADDRGVLAGYLRFLVGELLSPDSALHSPRALRASGALLLELYAAAASMPAPDVREGPASLAHVRRAEEAMRSRFHEPLTIAEIARQVGVGPRSLQAAFGIHRKLTPRQALTTMRLNAARDRLLAPLPDETVTDIALGCGFAHLSRFAGAYARRYGEPPSATLARARRPATPAV